MNYAERRPISTTVKIGRSKRYPINIERWNRRGFTSLFFTSLKKRTQTSAKNYKNRTKVSAVSKKYLYLCGVNTIKVGSINDVEAIFYFYVSAK